MQHADIAQAVERHIGNVEVTGSTPVISLNSEGVVVDDNTFF